MKAKTVSRFAKKTALKFKGGVPKDQRQVKGVPGGKVLAQRSERGFGLKFKIETYQTVSSFKPGTKIKYGPNPKTPGSKSFTRYAGYEKAKTVAESLKGGSKLADLCWELERGMYSVIGGERSEQAERAAVGDKWYEKAQSMLNCFNGPRGLNMKLNDPKAAKALEKEEAWRGAKLKKVEHLAKIHKIKIENEAELKKMGMHEAHELHAERKVCDTMCAKMMAEAAKAGRKISDQDLTDAMELWGFKQNSGRLNVMREGVKYVYSDTIGAILRRCNGYGLTPATRHYPNFVKLLCKWCVDQRLEEKLGVPFKFTAINLNANYAGARHRDGNNEGPSVIRACGKFTGGKLMYWPKDSKKTGPAGLKKLKPEDAKVFDLKNDTTIFDGNRAHEVQPFEGSRYSIVFFTANGYRKLKPADAKYLQSVAMPFPTPKAMEELKRATTKFVEGKAKVSTVRKNFLKKKNSKK